MLHPDNSAAYPRDSDPVRSPARPPAVLRTRSQRRTMDGLRQQLQRSRSRSRQPQRQRTMHQLRGIIGDNHHRARNEYGRRSSRDRSSDNHHRARNEYGRRSNDDGDYRMGDQQSHGRNRSPPRREHEHRRGHPADSRSRPRQQSAARRAHEYNQHSAARQHREHSRHRPADSRSRHRDRQRRRGGMTTLRAFTDLIDTL